MQQLRQGPIYCLQIGLLNSIYSRTYIKFALSALSKRCATRKNVPYVHDNYYLFRNHVDVDNIIKEM